MNKKVNRTLFFQMEGGGGGEDTNPKKRKRSKIWSYFIVDNEFNKCIVPNCEAKYSTKTSNTILIRHLTQAHDIDLKETSKQKKLPLNERILNWIIVDNQSLNVVEREEFRNLFEEDIAHRGAITSSLNEKFDGIQLTIKNELKQLTSKISIGVDCWSSVTLQSFIGITIHYCIGGCRKNVLLDIVKLSRQHSGKELAKGVISVLRNFEVENKLGWIISDNASNNLSMITEIASILPNFRTKNHIRCLNHILNLLMVDLCFSGNIEEIPIQSTSRKRRHSSKRTQSRPTISISENNSNYICDNIEKNYNYKEVIIKVRNIIKDIRKSPNQYSVFQELCVQQQSKSRNINIDNSTRWDSTCKMLKKFIYHKGRIAQISGELHLDQLSYDELIVINDITSILSKFEDVSKNLQSNDIHIGWGLAIYNHLFEIIESINNYEIKTKLMRKLASYYKLAADETPAFAIGSWLNPQCKTPFFIEMEYSQEELLNVNNWYFI
jgi:hypothetical protein